MWSAGGCLYVSSVSLSLSLSLSRIFNGSLQIGRQGEDKKIMSPNFGIIRSRGIT